MNVLFVIIVQNSVFIRKTSVIRNGVFLSKRTFVFMLRTDYEKYFKAEAYGKFPRGMHIIQDNIRNQYKNTVLKKNEKKDCQMQDFML